MNDEYYMRLALKEAETAFNADEVPVGAVIVQDDTVIASAYNSKEAQNDPTAHAEVNVIRLATSKTDDWRLNNATLYVTKEPCIMCTGAMLNARLGRLVFGCRDERFGAVNSRYQLAYDPSFNHNIKVVAGVLEKECARILSEFFKKRR